MKKSIHFPIEGKLNLFSYTTAFLALICGAICFFTQHNLYAFINLSITLTLVINTLINYKMKLKISVLLLAISTFFIGMLYTGGLLHSGWLLSLTLPSIFSLLIDKNTTLKFNFLYAFSLLSVLLLQFFFDFLTAYSIHDLLILIIVYVFNSYIIFHFQIELDNSNSKLTKINAELNDKIAQEIKANEKKNKLLSIQAKQAQMGEMISMIAHQWRQPLNSISASAIKLKLENDLGVLKSESIDKSSIFIQDRTQDMSEIINNFLDYAKPNSKNIHFTTKELIDKVYSIINTQFSLRGIFLSIVYEDKAKVNKIHGVENLLEQVVLNLLINTRDAFDEHNDIAIKKVEIRIDIDNNIYIQDNAGGIPSVIADKVFNPYFTTKEEGKGTGLGLYMSQKIMRDNFDGDLTYEPMEDGSCFIISFNTDADKSSKGNL